MLGLGTAGKSPALVPGTSVGLRGHPAFTCGRELGRRDGCHREVHPGAGAELRKHGRSIHRPIMIEPATVALPPATMGWESTSMGAPESMRSRDVLAGEEPLSQTSLGAR